ncbi:MAG: choice-of-anchor B family protein [Planctomycetes bacterium]|nr:choice-of-anchor B family protein [Planctomycetota bacterium]
MYMRHLCSAAFALATSLLAPTVSAQGFNCQLVGTFPFQAGANFNDVWGYVAPNGDEYALLGATTGLVVVDCTNPAQPVQRGYFPWATSTWRDIRTYSHYAYVVTESGAGFQIIDLANPNAPTLVGVFGTANSNNAHDVCIDTGTGKMYLVGCNTGTPVYDLAANPANPTFLGYALGSGNSNYFHDLCVENGYAYGSMIYNGVLRIIDVTQGLSFNSGTLSNTPTPAAFTHNAWPNAAGTICVTTDERAGGVVKFFDITNKAAPIPLGQFTPNPASIPHNAYIVGNLCHVSWYTEGYQCIDITDPMNPVQVAAYDTWPGASGGYNGAWGCYPFQPSGNIYISDISTGLYILRPQITDLAITHTPIADTTNEDGPYTVLADISGSNPISSMTLSYRYGSSGAFTTVPLNPFGPPNLFVADIPGHDAVATVEYHIDAVDSQAARRSPVSGEYSFLIGSATTVWIDDFEQDLGWTHGMTATQDDWQRGAPQGASGTSGGVGWQDPSSAWSGTNIWANDLGGAGFNGSYQNSTGNWLQSPLIPTGGAQGLSLRFRRWLSLAVGDTATVLVNGTPVFTTSAAVQDTSWQEVVIDIASIANSQTQLTVRFELATNATNVAGGWGIDDVELVQYSDAAPPLLYGNPTPGTGNQNPGIGMSAPAALGTTTQIQGSNMLPNALGILAMNFADANLMINGVEVLVQPAGAAAIFQVTSGSGLASWPFAVPNNPAFDNFYVYSQAFVLDPGAATGIASSLGMRLRICQN